MRTATGSGFCGTRHLGTQGASVPVSVTPGPCRQDLRCRNLVARHAWLGAAACVLIRVDDVLGISGGDPSFRSDDGSARPEVAVALADFAAGEGTEQAVLTALATSRLLVPVVAVLAELLDADPDAVEGGSGPRTPTGSSGKGGEKASEMAMPTLIGLDGRRAVPAFTSLESMSRWQSDARPVPVAAQAVWQSACADAAAVVIDVAGPVPFAVEGTRLAALARGEAAPPPYADPDVHEIVAAVLADQLEVASFELQPDDTGRDLAIVLALTAEAAGRSEADAAQLGADVVGAVMARLGGRLRRGVAVWLGSYSDAT
jgi:hypothetical protein